MAPKRKVIAKKHTPYTGTSSSKGPSSSRSGQQRQPPAEAQPAVAPYGFPLRNAAQESACALILQRQIINMRYLDTEAMSMLGLYEDVQWMYENIGWQQFFGLHHVTYIPLTLEFFSSLTVKVSTYDDADKDRVAFRLQGKEFSLTLQHINQMFGFPEDRMRRAPRDYNESEFWKIVSNDNYYSSKTARASSISNPVLRYVHMVLAHTIFGRGESDSMVRSTEVLFIWAMLHGFKLNSAYFLVKQLYKVARAQKGMFVMGGLVTHIALALGVDPTAMQKAKGRNRIDLDSCISMKLIVKEGDDYCLIFKGSEITMPLPNQRRTTIRDKQNWNLGPEVVEEIPTISTAASIPPPGRSFGFGASSSSFAPEAEARWSRIEEKLDRLLTITEGIDDTLAQMRFEISSLHDENSGLSDELKRQAKFMSSFWASFSDLKTKLQPGDDDSDDIRGDGDDDTDSDDDADDDDGDGTS